MIRTPAATVLAAYSLTGFGKVNTHIVYRTDRVLTPTRAVGLTRARPVVRSRGWPGSGGGADRPLEETEALEAGEAVDPSVDALGHGLTVVVSEEVAPDEVDLLVGDPTKAEKTLGWQRDVDFAGLVQMMVEADLALVQRTLA